MFGIFIQDSRKQLDVDYILSKIKVSTPFGQKKKSIIPWFKADEISALTAHYDKLEHLKQQMEKHPVTFKKLRSLMSHFKNIELTLERIYSKEALSVTELFEIKYFAMILKSMDELLSSSSLEVEFDLSRLKTVEYLLDPEEMEMNTFYIYDSYHERLATIRHEIKRLEHQLSQDKQDKIKKISDLFDVKIRPSGELRVERHRLDLIMQLDDCNDLDYASETMMHRLYKVKVDSDHRLISALKLEEEEIELDVRLDLTLELYEHLDVLKQKIDAIGQLDLLMGKAYFAIAYKMVRPNPTSEKLSIVSGRYLKVLEHLNQKSLSYTPVSLSIDKGVTVITGANMGGKTIALKMIGQMAVMAHMGLFVPCEAFEFTPYDYIFISSQDGQSVDKGLSTFGAEMVNVSDVIRRHDRGLNLIDELARGTNPSEGYAISKAIINHFKKEVSTTVITTHFDGLADEKDVLHLQVKGLKDVDFEDLKINMTSKHIELIHEWMDYGLQVIEGPEMVPKDAISVAKLMGLNDGILEDARTILLDKRRQNE